MNGADPPPLPRANRMTLRPARNADAGSIGGIWRDGWRDGHAGHVPDELVAVRTPESFELRASQRIRDTVVAIVGNAIAGFVMVVEDEVEQVYVARAHRGTGVAAALLAEAERLVGRNGHEQAWLAVVAGNSRARGFYERCGWVDEGLIDYPAATAAGPILVPAHRYVKRFAGAAQAP
jgi:GNAT superfamily N-acetyltransferase